MTSPERPIAEPWRSMVPKPHPPANCGPLTLPLPPGAHCPTCGTLPPGAAGDELDDRRQRAREAFHDGSPTMHGDVIDEVHAAAEAAIETATRVRVTETVISHARTAASSSGQFVEYEPMRSALIAAFRAAGFEVEE